MDIKGNLNMEKFKQFTLLYIEDDDGTREINARVLQRMFKKVYTANNGVEGYDIYKKQKPHIILCDIKMPKMDGIELAKKIRANDKKTKIIIISAFNDTKYLLDAVELDIVRYIIKPLTKRNLIPALEKAISSLKESKKLYFAKGFYYDYATSLFYQNDNIIKMSKKELRFLQLLVENIGKIVPYSKIEQEVWNNEYMSKNSLRTTIGFIRKKIPKNIIENISNMGYRLLLRQSMDKKV